jgi:hypothetical protein
MDAETWKLVVDISQATAALAGGLSAIFAGWALRSTNSARADAVLLGQAALNLERSYEALFGDGYDDNNPRYEPNDWLLSARLITDFVAVQRKIKSKLTKLECLSHEEHWRMQFAKRIDSLEQKNSNYFQNRTEPVEKLAVRAVYLFATPNPIGNLERLQSRDVQPASGITAAWPNGKTYST